MNPFSGSDTPFDNEFERTNEGLTAQEHQERMDRIVQSRMAQIQQERAMQRARQIEGELSETTYNPQNDSVQWTTSATSAGSTETEETPMRTNGRIRIMPFFVGGVTSTRRRATNSNSKKVKVERDEEDSFVCDDF